jgi:hypothetical protein
MPVATARTIGTRGAVRTGFGAFSVSVLIPVRLGVHRLFAEFGQA